jgi:hypothetical protein
LNDVIGKLSSEDLWHWRTACAMHDALEINPKAYSPADAQKIYQVYFKVGGNLAERYGIDIRERWRISPYTGEIYYEDD